MSGYTDRKHASPKRYGKDAYPKRPQEARDRERRAPENDIFEETRLEGRQSVREAYRAGRTIDKLYVQEGVSDTAVETILRYAKEAGTIVTFLSREKLDGMSLTGQHQGVIAQAAAIGYTAPEDLLRIAKEKGEDPFLFMLDGIEDPHNLGAIIRTAETAGADGVIIPKRRSAMLTPTVYKTSAGAASWLPVARVPNLGAAIDRLKEENIWVYGTDMNGSLYTETNFDGGVALVIGSEGNGMSRLVREKCDFLVKLPMMGRITSLNASVAAGIFMYEVVRQRSMRG